MPVLCFASDHLPSSQERTASLGPLANFPSQRQAWLSLVPQVWSNEAEQAVLAGQVHPKTQSQEIDSSRKHLLYFRIKPLIIIK